MQIQQDNFIQKLLSLEKGRAYIPDLRKKRTWYLKKLSDAKLVKYIRRGNNHAFDVLIKRHEPKLKEIIRHALFNRSQADDVLQDVWEMVIPKIRNTSPLLVAEDLSKATPEFSQSSFAEASADKRKGEQNSRYRENGNFYGWLSTIAYRHTMTLNRTKVHAPELMEELPDLPEEGNYHELSEEDEQLLDEAKEIISTFNKQDRKIFELHYEEGLPLKSIARQLRKSPNIVRARHSRCMKKLKDSMKKHKQPGTRSI